MNQNKVVISVKTSEEQTKLSSDAENAVYAGNFVKAGNLSKPAICLQAGNFVRTCNFVKAGNFVFKPAIQSPSLPSDYVY